jgi:hypothetical protein
MVIFNLMVRFSDAGGTGPMQDMGDFQSPQEATAFIDTVSEACAAEGINVIATSIVGVSIIGPEGFGARG